VEAEETSIMGQFNSLFIITEFSFIYFRNQTLVKLLLESHMLKCPLVQGGGKEREREYSFEFTFLLNL
jgi:hypothetical protein